MDSVGRSQTHQSAGRWWPFAATGVLLATALPALIIDCPTARWFQQNDLPGDVRTLVEFLEVFGHGLGVLLIGLVIFELDRARRWALPRVLAAAFGAGLAADLVKLLVARVRPRHFDTSSGVLASFEGWLPLGRMGSAHQSFPSAHTATAVGLAFALVWLYPQGRRLFPLLALGVAVQRVVSCSHFPSDVLSGAAVGCLVAGLLLYVGPLPDRFERWEQAWKGSESKA